MHSLYALYAKNTKMGRYDSAMWLAIVMDLLELLATNGITKPHLL
jgi:heme exporter protein D